MTTRKLIIVSFGLIALLQTPTLQAKGQKKGTDREKEYKPEKGTEIDSDHQTSDKDAGKIGTWEKEGKGQKGSSGKPTK